MKIYNGTNSQINLPYVGNQRISIGDHSVSGDLGANIPLLTTLVSAYDTSEIAIIATGPYELSMCASIPTVTNYVVQSLDEAIERLEAKKAVKKETVEEVACEAVEPEIETADTCCPYCECEKKKEEGGTCNCECNNDEEPADHVLNFANHDETEKEKLVKDEDKEHKAMPKSKKK